MKKGISGVYRMTNRKNGKIYIGSSKCCSNRKSEHKTTNNGTVVARAIAKHGWHSFAFEIVEECPIDQLRAREQHWLDSTQCYNRKIGYNVARDAACFSRGVKHSKAWCKALSERMKGRPCPTKGIKFSKARRKAISDRLKIFNPCIGRKVSPETRDKISAANKGKLVGAKNPNYGKPLPKWHKKIISEVQKKRALPVKQISLRTGRTLKIWPSLRAATEHFATSSKGYCRILCSVKHTLEEQIIRQKKRKPCGFGFGWLYHRKGKNRP